jgi:uncharacterized membrane protein YfcA
MGQSAAGRDEAGILAAPRRRGEAPQGGYAAVALGIAGAAALVGVLLLVRAPALQASQPAAEAGAAGTIAWWIWPLMLLGLTFVLGILAAVGGVGGGVLFVPIVSGFLPFHLDFVRGCGLLVAMSGALAAGPGFLRMNLASLRLAIPLALIASTCSIVGALVGLALPADVLQTALGATILGVVAVMMAAKRSVFPTVRDPDRLASALRIYGVYREASLSQSIDWRVHRTATGLVLFMGIGLVAGMFGLGAGWANIPVLNLVMGAPLKISVATSKFLLSITDTSAAWVYLNKGCVIPMMVVPSLVGIMFGSLIGVRILRVAKPAFVRWIVIALLLFSGAKAVTQGLGLPFIV